VSLDLGTVYRTELACREMVLFMAAELKDNIKVRVRKVEMEGVAFDEATDQGLDQGLIVYIKFVEDGKPVTVFLAMIDLQAQDSETIFEVVKEELTLLHDGDEEAMLKALLAMGTDGCSVLIGTKKGVTTRFKKLQVRLLCIHCPAHRLALAVKDAADDIDEMEYLSEHVRMISGLFSRSVKRRKALNKAQAEQGLRLLNIIRDIVTRWLSKGACFKRLIENIQPLHQFLTGMDDKACDDGEDQEMPQLVSGSSSTKRPVRRTKVLGLLESHTFHVQLCGVNDITEVMNNVSRVFQQTNVTGLDVQIAIRCATKGLTGSWVTKRDGKVMGGPSTRNLLLFSGDSTQIEGGRGMEYQLSGGIYKKPTGGVSSDSTGNYSIKVTGGEGEEEAAFEMLEHLASNIVENLNERFSDLPLMALFDVLCPSRIPIVEEERLTFGRDQVLELLDMYGVEKKKDDRTYPPIINSAVIAEYDLLKEDMAQRGMLGKGRDKDFDLFESLLTDANFNSGRYKNVIFLVKLKLTLVLQTADCERGFSLRTQIKTNQRSSMGNILLDVLMMIVSNGPKVDDRTAVMRLVGAGMQRFKGHKARHPDRSAAGIGRRMRKVGRSPLGELEAWAAAVFNEGRDEETADLLEERSVAIPDVVVQTEEERERDEIAADEADERSENDFLDNIPAYEAPSGWAVLAALPANSGSQQLFPGVPNMCPATTTYLAPKKGTKKEVVCKFKGGWERGSVHMQEKSEKRGSKGYF
jgi:hypothetical protein